MWDVPRGWAVPVRLGCPGLAGLSQFGWGVPAAGHPTLGQAVPFHWVIPALHGTSHEAGLSRFGWAVPVWLGCPTFDWVVPAAGHPTLARAVPFHWVIPVPLELLNVKGHSLLRCLTLTI